MTAREYISQFRLSSDYFADVNHLYKKATRFSSNCKKIIGYQHLCVRKKYYIIRFLTQIQTEIIDRILCKDFENIIPSYIKLFNRKYRKNRRNNTFGYKAECLHLITSIGEIFKFKKDIKKIISNTEISDLLKQNYLMTAVSNFSYIIVKTFMMIGIYKCPNHRVFCDNCAHDESFIIIQPGKFDITYNRDKLLSYLERDRIPCKFIIDLKHYDGEWHHSQDVFYNIKHLIQFSNVEICIMNYDKVNIYDNSILSKDMITRIKGGVNGFFVNN